MHQSHVPQCTIFSKQKCTHLCSEWWIVVHGAGALWVCEIWFIVTKIYNDSYTHGILLYQVSCHLNNDYWCCTISTHTFDSHRTAHFFTLQSAFHILSNAPMKRWSNLVWMYVHARIGLMWASGRFSCQNRPDARNISRILVVVAIYNRFRIRISRKNAIKSI